METLSFLSLFYSSQRFSGVCVCVCVCKRTAPTFLAPSHALTVPRDHSQSRFRVRSPVKKAHTESAALAEPSVKELGRGHNRDLGLVSAPLSPQAALGDKGGRTPQPCVPRGFSSEPPRMDEAVAACKCQKQRRRVTRCTSPQVRSLQQGGGRFSHPKP